MKKAQLPILEFAESIIHTVRHHQVTIVVGTTGCGKTTHIPAILFRAGFAERGKIACTVPTRPAAMMAAEYVSKRAKQPVGGTVGYEVRLDKKVSGKTKILYLTDGLLLQRLHSDPHLEEFDVIMVDEVHERRQTTDYLLAYLKSLIQIRPNLRVIVSSATLHAHQFSRYFDSAPIVNIMTRQHPVEVIHRQLFKSPFVAIAEEVRNFSSQQAGHVLVFLPGIREIMQAQVAVERLKLNNMVCLSLHGRMNREEQLRVFTETPERKVILATNIAETALTIPGVRYVIDLGTERHEGVLEEHGVKTLWIKPTSQASATQRAGRAGRTEPGVCIRLYSEESFQARPEFTPPEVETGDILGMVLQLLGRGVRQPETLDFLTPLPKQRVDAACDQLLAWGAINEERDLTALGKRMLRLPLPPQLARMVVLAAEQNFGFEAAEVAGFLSVRNISHREGGVDVRINGKHGQFRDPRGDALTFLQVMLSYRERHHDPSWCQGQGIDQKLLDQVILIRDQVIHRLGWKFVPRHGMPDFDAIHRALIRSWGGRLCVYHQSGTYRSGDLHDIRIAKDSSLAGREFAAFIASDLTHIGECIARYPITVPEDMMDEVFEIYGNPNPLPTASADGKSLRAHGTLRIETAHGQQLLHLDVDCVRSTSRELRVVRSQSLILEEANFPIRWLRLSLNTQIDLAQLSVSTLAELPKTKRELERLGLKNERCEEILRSLTALGYMPKKAREPEPDLEVEPQLELAESGEEEPKENDWLVQGLVKGSLTGLQLSRRVTMRLLGARIDTVEKLLRLSREEVREICNREDALVEEVNLRLEDFGFQLKSRSEIRQAKAMTAEPKGYAEAVQVDVARAVSILGAEDFELFERYQSASTYLERTRVRNELIVKHRGLLQKVGWMLIGEVARHQDEALEMCDLEQEAVFGAIAAIRKFKHRAGFRYSTYALHWMKQAASRMIMNQGAVRIPVHLGEKVDRFRRTVGKLEKEFGRMPTVLELAERMNTTPERVEYLYSLVNLLRSRSLEDPYGHDKNGEDVTTLGDTLFDSESVSATDQLAESQESRGLKQALNEVFTRLSLELPARAIKVFKLRYGLEGEDPKTLEEVGALYGLTRERIRQIELTVMEKFRTIEVWARLRRVAPWLNQPPADLLEDDDEEDEQEEDSVPNEGTTAEEILSNVAKQHGLSVPELLARNREQNVVQARWMAMVRLREELNMSFPAIAQALGLSDHTTVMHGYERGKEMLLRQAEVAPSTDIGKEYVP